MDNSFRSVASNRSAKNNVFDNFEPDLPDDDETLSQSSNKSKKATSHQNQYQYNRNQQNYNNYNQQGQWSSQQRGPRFNNNQNDNYGYQKNNNNWHHGQKFQNNNQGYNNYNNYGQNQGYGRGNNYGHGTQFQRNQLYATQKDHFPAVDIKKELGQADLQGQTIDQSYVTEMNKTKVQARKLGVNESLIGYDKKHGNILDEKEQSLSKEEFERIPDLKAFFLKGERVLLHNIDHVEIDKIKIKPDCGECTIKRFFELDLEKKEFMASMPCKVCYATSKNYLTTSVNSVFQKSGNQVIFAKISASGTKDIKVQDIEKVFLSITCADCRKKYPVEIPPEKEKNKNRNIAKENKKEEKKEGNNKQKGKKNLKAPGEKVKEETDENLDDLDDDKIAISYNVACSTWNCYNLLVFEVKRFSIALNDFEPVKTPPPAQEIVKNK